MRNTPLQNTPDLMQRGGRFKFSAALVRFPSPELLDFMSEVLVVRCEMDFATDLLCYTALSPHFERVEPSLDYPEYRIELRPTVRQCDHQAEPRPRARKL